jgi:hypothetical protein
MQPSKVCAEELSPFVGQLRRDMQHWMPKSISSPMLHRVRSICITTCFNLFRVCEFLFYLRLPLRVVTNLNLSPLGGERL